MLQHVPYVKTMFSAVMALKGACSQAVHNKDRCTALAECVVHRHPMNFVHESVRRAHVACECVEPAGGSKGSAPY